VIVLQSKINFDKIANHAKTLYTTGFSCSESIVCAIRDEMKLDLPREIIAMASGFSAGMSSGCACGALTGGVMALGIFFGKSELGHDSTRVRELSNELYEYFRNTTNKESVYCRTLTSGLDMSLGEHKSQCAEYVGAVAKKVSEIVNREML